MSVVEKRDINSKSSQSGFTLIESALVFLIMGLIMFPLFGFLAERRSYEAQYQEDRHEERIKAALLVYYNLNQRYPCPADIAENITAATFGQETACAGGGVSTGSIPVHALDLPWEYSFNRYGWKYIYAVTNTATVDNSQPGIIQINDGTNTFINNLKYVVVNPGRDGKGSNRRSGVANPNACNVTPLDGENCNGDNIFTDAERAFPENINSATYYDDTIIYALTSENDAMFIARDGQNFNANTKDIINRNEGNLGIGFVDVNGNMTGTMGANAKLQISGSRCQVSGCTGERVGLQVNGDIKSDGARRVRAFGTLSAGRDIEASSEAVSPRFCYGAAACP